MPHCWNDECGVRVQLTAGLRCLGWRKRNGPHEDTARRSADLSAEQRAERLETIRRVGVEAGKGYHRYGLPTFMGRHESRLLQFVGYR